MVLVMNVIIEVKYRLTSEKVENIPKIYQDVMNPSIS